jgi:hypothetical protein
VLEPFLQAIIEYDGGETNIITPSQNASIGRVARLDAGFYEATRADTTQRETFADPADSTGRRKTFSRVEWFSQPDAGVIGSIWNGFFNPVASEIGKPGFSCATGNCSWTPYATLSVCSRCVDISHHIEKETGFIWPNASTYRVGMPFDELTMTGGNLPLKKLDYTKYSIPSLMLNLSNPHGSFDNPDPGSKETLQPRFNPCALFSARSESNPGRTISFRALESLIISYSYMNSSASYHTLSGPWENATVMAGECALYFCVKILKSDIKLGRLEEITLGTWTNRTKYSFGYEGLEKVGKNQGIIGIEELSESQRYEDYELYNKFKNYSLYPGDLDAHRSDLQIFVPEDAATGIPHLPRNTLLRFNVSQVSTATMAKWLRDDFSRRPDPLANKQLVYPTFTRPESDQPLLIRSLGESLDLKVTFEAVAESVSKWMRDQALRTEPLHGDTKQYIVHIKIRWGFLAFPVAALLCGSLFALLSIRNTKKVGLPPWKSSSLAILTHGLDSQTRSQMMEADSVGSLDRKSRSVSIKLEQGGFGLELVQGTSGRSTLS